MITYVPNYYSRFKCIADKCQHTCCKGWEIDVDDESMERFAKYENIISKIKDNSFILEGAEERCPFLREDLLCQMIIDHGEDFICNICKDHPRFRNYYDDRIEMGVGLCCEATCDLIIDNKEPFALEPQAPLSQEISVLNQFDTDILSRLDSIDSVKFEASESISMYQDMEVLDEDCAKVIAACKRDENEVNKFISVHKSQFEQIAIYYAYRYPKMPSFAVEACKVIAGCAIEIGGSIKSIKEAARIYSSEVEYSDVNMEIIEDVFMLFGEDEDDD